MPDAIASLTIKKGSVIISFRPLKNNSAVSSKKRDYEFWCLEKCLANSVCSLNIG